MRIDAFRHAGDVGDKVCLLVRLALGGCIRCDGYGDKNRKREHARGTMLCVHWGSFRFVCNFGEAARRSCKTPMRQKLFRTLRPDEHDILSCKRTPGEKTEQTVTRAPSSLQAGTPPR